MAKKSMTFSKRSREMKKKDKKETKAEKMKTRKTEKKSVSLKTDVGKYIISMNFGLGTIIGFKEIDGDTYYAVRTTGSTATSFFPVTGMNNFRFISDEPLFNQALSKMDEKRQDIDFGNPSDRLNYIKATTECNNIHMIIDRMMDFIHCSNLSKVELQLMGLLVETVAIEYSSVFNLELTASRTFVKEKLALVA